MFSRRDVVVAVAPHLYGQDPQLLDVLVGRLLVDAEVVPLVAVDGARERVFSLAGVLARETAIADGLERQLRRSDGPAVTAAEVTSAIEAVESELAVQLSAEQAEAAMAICTSRRAAEIVVGVAGAGKTTMLKAVAAAFDDAGYRVVGTATSGQAAQNLGREADLVESRTLASLMWRVEQNLLRLDKRCVVLCDETGMTDDIDLLRLTAHTEAADAKLVLIGDHRQLGAVGPGGALQGLVARHCDAVHFLMGNRRQDDPGERQALGELREGDIAAAVSWYETHGRIHAVDDRDGALQAAVGAWAADVTAGRDTALLAWRRANVAALNHIAREWMHSSGRLHGPELLCPGGSTYQAGDLVVTLAPGPNGSLVTSQRATVTSVDAGRGALTLRTEDGRSVTLAAEQAGAEKLGYGYATTVHRCQGATVSRAHLFADGGGRELAYVAMSRARQKVDVWSVADDIAQAAEDLRRDWSQRRTPTWAIDLGQPSGRDDGAKADSRLAPGQVQMAAVAAAQADLTRAATVTAQPPGCGDDILHAQRRLHTAKQDRADLEAGRGVYVDTNAGRAARDLREARRAKEQASWEAEHAPRRKDRRRASDQIGAWAERQADAERRWQLHVVPEATRLDDLIHSYQLQIERLEARADRERERYSASVHRTLEHADTSRKMARVISVYRDRLDGLEPADRPIQRIQRPSDGLAPAPTHEAPPPQIGIGM